ncbi:MAG: cupin domain-containing protein [Acidobacteria bacterium]|nr:cupin domain-containing protein [Acidobacteriota bacterium]
MKHHKLNEIPEEWVTDMFSRKFFTGDKITLAFLTLKKGCAVPRHQHDSEQFSYIISGALKFVIEGQEIIVRGGEIMEIPSNVPHEAVAIEDTTGIDVFSPIRADWVDGTDNYLRSK